MERIELDTTGDCDGELTLTNRARSRGDQVEVIAS